MSIEEMNKTGQDTNMNRPEKKASLVPTHDYEQARQKAVSWLGDRYLLAEPARKRPDTRQEYFNPGFLRTTQGLR
jgi:hypothetical protein